MSAGDSRPKQVPASAQRAGEYWILVPRRSADVAVVNAVGYYVFQQCDGSRSEEDIAHAVAGAAGASVVRVRGDVAVFLARLEAAGLLIR